MPIHLAPISRRRFLARTLAAGGGLMLAPELFAKTKALDKNLWIFLSDTHLSQDRAKVERGVNMTNHFEQVSKEVLELPKRAAGLFLMGDCAFSSGQKGDYALLQELLEPIRASQTPVHLALGNHDNREQFWEVLSAQKGENDRWRTGKLLFSQEHGRTGSSWIRWRKHCKRRDCSAKSSWNG